MTTVGAWNGRASRSAFADSSSAVAVLGFDRRLQEQDRIEAGIQQDRRAITSGAACWLCERGPDGPGSG